LPLPSALAFALGNTIVIAVAVESHPKASGTMMLTIKRRFITATRLIWHSPDSGWLWGQDRASGRLAQRQTVLSVG